MKIQVGRDLLENIACTLSTILLARHINHEDNALTREKYFLSDRSVAKIS
jgi:hypothetical protein